MCLLQANLYARRPPSPHFEKLPRRRAASVIKANPNYVLYIYDRTDKQTPGHAGQKKKKTCFRIVNLVRTTPQNRLGAGGGKGRHKTLSRRKGCGWLLPTY